MNKRQVIQHAKNYLEMLTEGTDPITREVIGEDSVVSNPQIKKCFQFVSAILGEVLENNGLVLLDMDEINAANQDTAVVPVTINGNGYELVRKKVGFTITPEQKREIFISQVPLTPTRFLNNVNRKIDSQRMEKLSLKSVNAWLQKSGYIAQGKTQMVINKTVWMPTQQAQQIGIAEFGTIDPQTGEIKRQLMFSAQAQAFLLDHLEEIVTANDTQTTRK